MLNRKIFCKSGACCQQPRQVGLVSDVVEKKRGLDVEVESRASSKSKQLRRVDVRTAAASSTKHVKSRRTFSKNPSDLLTFYNNNAH